MNFFFFFLLLYFLPLLVLLHGRYYMVLLHASIITWPLPLLVSSLIGKKVPYKVPWRPIYKSRK